MATPIMNIRALTLAATRSVSFFDAIHFGAIGLPLSKCDPRYAKAAVKRWLWRQTHTVSFLPFAATAAAEQSFEFFLEFADIFEVTVDGGEADVGNGVEAFEVLHD
jgi:hypothetical protein